MPLLEVTSLNYVSDSGGFFNRQQRHILKDITFSVEDGKILGLIGESGSGKTTLAKCISGLLVPASGKITFIGVDIFPNINNRQRIGASIQLLFQNHTASLDPMLKIKKTLLEGVGKNDLDAKVALPKLLSLVELEEEVSSSARSKICIVVHFT
jgi:ABC-type dipeptide/oligopeptide/nickel transport system ATPase subunit